MSHTKSEAPLLKSLLLDNEKNGKALWIDTFYFTIPYNITNMKKSLIPICREVRPKFVDVVLEFSFLRVSEIKFKFLCFRKTPNDSTAFGDYKINFRCNINVFDVGTKVFEMQKHGTLASTDFVLTTSYLQELSASDLEKHFEFMILIELIEYDCVLTGNVLRKKREFCEENPHIFNNKSLLQDLCYILSISNLEDIFKGPQMLSCISKKCKAIKRTVKFAEEIAEYLRRKEMFATQPLTDLKLLSSFLNYVLNEVEGTICDRDLVIIYIGANYLGLDFLVEISRDCFLYKLSTYEILELPYFENLMFEILLSAIHVGDEDLLHEATIKMICSKDTFFQFERFFERLKLWDIHSRFAFYFLKERLNILESLFPIGSTEAETSRYFESLPDVTL